MYKCIPSLHSTTTKTFHFVIFHSSYPSYESSLFPLFVRSSQRFAILFFAFFLFSHIHIKFPIIREITYITSALLKLFVRAFKTKKCCQCLPECQHLRQDKFFEAMLSDPNRDLSKEVRVLSLPDRIRRHLF